MKTKVLVVDRVYKCSKNIFDMVEDFEFIPVAKEENTIAAMTAECNAHVLEHFNILCSHLSCR